MRVPRFDLGVESEFNPMPGHGALIVGALLAGQVEGERE